MSAATIHAGCVLVGEAGILIRGPSGSGKSTLGRRLVELGLARCRFARLVGDDRIVLSVHGGRVVARPAAPLAGLLEVRGLGLLPEEHEGAARLALVVDCQAEHPGRYPEEAATSVAILGVGLPRLALLPALGAENLVLKSLARMTLPKRNAPV